MHTCHNIVQKQRQCIVGALETHSFKAIVVKKRKFTAFYIPVSNSNNFAENDFHQKFERLMILQYQKSPTDLYGSLYVTLCFVLRRFDFGVLTFYFRILSFLFCVLFTMLFTLNGAIHEVETRYRRKDGRKTKL